MHKYKLINYKDIFKLWVKKFYIFLTALVLLFTLFFFLEKGSGKKSYVANASISLNYYEDGHFDYEQSQRITSNFNRFTIDTSSLDNENISSIRLIPIQYSNILNASCVSKDKDIAISTANKLAEMQTAKLIEENIDGVSQKTIFKLEQKAIEARLNTKNITNKQKLSLSILLIGFIAVAEIIAELLRTKVKTTHEARLITGSSYAVDISPNNKIDKNAVLELKKVINNRSFVIVPIGSVKNTETISAQFESTDIFTEDILQNAEAIDTMRSKELVIIYIKKNSCDYRELERAVSIIKASEIKLFGVILD